MGCEWSWHANVSSISIFIAWAKSWYPLPVQGGSSMFQPHLYLVLGTQYRSHHCQEDVFQQLLPCIWSGEGKPFPARGCSWKKCSAKAHEHWPLMSNMFHCHPYQKSPMDFDSCTRLNCSTGEPKGTCAWSLLDGYHTCHGRDFAKDASCSTCPTGAAATNLATSHDGPCDHATGCHGPCHHGTGHHGTRNHGTPNHGTGIWTNATHTVWANPAARSLVCDGKRHFAGEWGCKHHDHHPHPECGVNLWQNPGLRLPRANVPEIIITQLYRRRGNGRFLSNREASQKKLSHVFANFVSALISKNT